jgi:hypothetical protein
MKNSIFILLLLCSASFSFAQNVPSYVPTNGMVGWWPFNGNANDESGNGNNGVSFNATADSNRLNQQNKSLYFNGTNSGVELPGNVLPLTNGSYSINAWFKLTTSTSQLNGHTIFDDRDSTVWNSKGRYIIELAPVPVESFYQMSDVGPRIYSNSMPSNTWVNITCVYNSIAQKMFLFKNGAVVDSAVCTSNWFLSGNRKIQIGRCQSPIRYNGINYFTSHWKGQIDDIGIWNRALSPQEITALYQGCNINVNITPATANAAIGANTNLVASGGTTYQWQTNPANNGWQNVSNNSTYSGATTASLAVNNIQLQNHQQQFRVISGSGSCVDTAYALVNVTDTCINTVTNSISVTDTLIINAVLSGVNPPNNTNTLLVYPNPARTHITIDNGNFALMNGYTVRINNALGQTVFTQAVNQQQFFIDLSTWTGNGLYYLDLIDNSGNSVETKVIVVQ